MNWQTFAAGCRGPLLAMAVGIAGIAQGLASAQDDPGNSGQAGVTVQLPTLGVSIDAAGVLRTEVFPDATGRLTQIRRQAATAALSPDLQQPSPLRFVSLRKLDAAIAERASRGEPLTDAQLHLAGLQRIQYVLVDPDDGDILIGGPAEGWMKDLSGRVIGIDSGQPTLLLCDLLAALRTFAPARPLTTWVAVSIDPTADGLQRLTEFQQQLPARIPDHLRSETTARELADGMRESLGLSSIRVHGIPRRSHLAQVLVEADFRMKLMAIGLELPPLPMKTFISELKGQPKGMQRWWLVPDVQCVRQAQDELAIELVGRDVQLKTEVLHGRVTGSPPRASKLQPSRAARAYAAEFTEHFEELSRLRPIYAQLRNGIDLLIAAAWLNRQDAYQTAGFVPTRLLEDATLPIDDRPEMRQAPSVANAIWKGRLLILAVGGGVSIQASDAFQPGNLLADPEDRLTSVRNRMKIPDRDNWWWDAR